MANRVGHATANSRYENEIVDVLERTMPLTPGHNRESPRGSDEGKLFHLHGGSRVQVYEGGNRGGDSRRSRTPGTECEVGSNGPQQARSNPGNAVQVRQRPVGSIAVPVRNDPLRQRKPNPGEPSQVKSGGTIGIELLPRSERTVRRLRRLGVGGGASARS